MDAHIITGQTGTGKTGKAIALARKTGADIISADSRQIYTHLTIVTGKDVGDSEYHKVDTKKLDDTTLSIGYYVIDGVRVWGYDLINPNDTFSSHAYVHFLSYILRNTIDAKVPPIIVGGTYLYIQHALYGFDTTVSPDWKLRKNLENTSVEDLQQMLSNIDANVLENLNQSDRNNPHRLIRKIEIAQAEDDEGGERISKASPEPMLNPLSFTGIRFKDTATAEKQIAQRVYGRIEQGAFEETERLLDMGYSEKSPGMRTLGYTQIIEHIHGQTSYEEAVEKWIRAEIQYAKRQITFMKRDTHIAWDIV